MPQELVPLVEKLENLVQHFLIVRVGTEIPQSQVLDRVCCTIYKNP